MDNFMYLIIIIGLTIFIIFFGGQNKQELIEYNSNYFNNIKSIVSFENKINLVIKNKEKLFVNDKTFININKFLNTKHIIIPNFINGFIINLRPFKLFNIFDIIDKLNYKNILMIIFNYNNCNNLELMINNNNTNNKYNYEIEENSEYFYDLTKTISIVGIHHIYNNSNKNITITCFFIKKPFWYY